jgi:hypothetical protein
MLSEKARLAMTNRRVLFVLAYMLTEKK